MNPEPGTRNSGTCLVHREAVEQTRAAGGHQIRLAAAAARMRGVPRTVAAALFVVMAELCRRTGRGRRGRRSGAARRGFDVRVARPVVAGVVRRVRVSAAVGRRSRQDVVLVRHVAHAVDELLLLGQRELLAERVADARLFDGVAVQFSDRSGATRWPRELYQGPVPMRSRALTAPAPCVLR